MKRTLNQSFILNTLGTISYLCDANTNLCKDCISDFAKVLQCQICEEDELQELEKELLVIHSFIEIENIRFNGNIEYIEEINAGSECLVPIGLILEIVQNAIESRISKTQGGGTITISCEKEKNNFIISIKDKGMCKYGNELMHSQTNWMNDVKSEVELLCAGKVIEEKNENEIMITLVLPDL